MDWIRSSVEWQIFGLNIATLTFLATLFFTALQCLGLYMQGRRIEKTRSGESISVALFSYMAMVFLAFGYYGLVIHSIGSVLNGSVGLFYLLVLMKLSKFKGFTTREKKLVGLFVGVWLTEVLLPWKATVMTIIMGGAALPLAQQVLEIRRNRSIGSLDIRFIAIFTGSLTFWTGYAFATGNVPLMIVNPPMFVVLGTFYYYWFKYRSQSVVLEAQ